MKKISYIYIIIFILFVSGSSDAQVIQEWIRRIDGDIILQSQYTFKNYPLLELDMAGNIYAAGSVDSDPGVSRNADFLIVKYSPAGNLLWSKIYDNPTHGDDFLSDLKVDASGNVYVTGSSYIVTDTHNVFCTLKYNPSGTLQWLNNFFLPGSLDDFPAAMDADNYGNVCVAGDVHGTMPSHSVIIKIAASGTTAFSKNFKMGLGGTFAIDVEFDNSGNIINLIGFTPFEITYYSVYKLNANGDSLWCTGVGSQLHGGGVIGVQCDASDNLFIAGNATPYFESLFVGYASKLNSAGSIVWSWSYNITGYTQEIEAFKIDNSGSIYTTGNTYQNGYKFLSTKIDNGVLGWTRITSFPLSNSNYGRSIDVDGYGGIYVGGTIHRTNSGYDYLTIKYNTQGDSLWSMRYNHSANNSEELSNLRVDTSGNVYVTGTSRNANGTYSYATVKYNQITGIKPISSEIPKSFVLYQNFPNPFNPATKIRFDIPPSKGARGMIKLIIYDVLGRDIATLVNEHLKPGTYEVEWSAAGGGSNYPSGVYFYKLITIDYSETRKMVLIK